jgi:hypothetical protein
MEYDNETVPDVIGGAAGDASPAVLYGPRFTLQRISQVRCSQMVIVLQSHISLELYIKFEKMKRCSFPVY